MSLQEAILNEHKRIRAKIMYYRKVNRFTQGQLSCGHQSLRLLYPVWNAVKGNLSWNR